MDYVLEFCDEHFLDRAWAYVLPHPPKLSALASYLANSSLLNASSTLDLSSSAYLHPPSSSSSAATTSLLPRDSLLRQAISVYTIALVGALILYFLICSISYFLFFDRRLEHHPRFLPNQKRREIAASMIAAPCIDAMMLPWFLAEVNGKSKMYDRVDEYGWTYFFASMGMFLLFTDFAIYWIHRLEHHPRIYKHIHKPHHKWVLPTPWAALAFHPVDGYAQALPYHIFVFALPMHKLLYLALFVFVQVWTILIHDGDMISGHLLERYINSPAHHTLHHLYFTCNYGQYFTWADSYFDSYRAPEPELDPLIAALQVMRKKGLVDVDGNVIKQDKKSQ